MKVILPIALCMAMATSAQASCDKAFDGLWGWEAEVQGQCTVMTFANDSRKKQVGSGTWTNVGGSCDYQSPNKILEAEYDNLRYKNFSAKMINAETCELTFGTARVAVDTYGVWAPVSKKAWVKKSGRNAVSFCFENSGHQLAQCTDLSYSGAWN
ncbi:hypothetical protein [Xinfangfangia pollutisoli]|uniref:hypothetical protein n=1 Tax=Xinfangfangia pollutisoli TaxID=2865960 RepID=UPI001CD80699|nr:hypothetical protein [Xinfangfangia pollutisoli]